MGACIASASCAVKDTPTFKCVEQAESCADELRIAPACTTCANAYTIVNN